MNIGEASQATGLPSKTIRYYEDIKLVAPLRQENGYRHYDGRDIHKLHFLQRARGLGFSIEDCRALLSLYEDKHRVSADVKAIAQAHIAETDRKLEELNSLREMLVNLTEQCHGDDRPDCPILENLGGQEEDRQNLVIS